MEPGDLGPLPVSNVIIKSSAHLSIASQHSLMSWNTNVQDLFELYMCKYIQLYYC